MFGLWRKYVQEKRIYLDYAASTPLRPEILERMESVFRNMYGNPSSVHKEGVAASHRIASARTEIARALSVRVDDVTFTSGGTESNNLALMGHIEYLISLGTDESDIEIISTAVEHPSIQEVLAHLEKRGIVVHHAPIDADGRIVIDGFSKLLSSKTRLVSVAYANSETGVLQDLGKLARIIHTYEKAHATQIVFHTDACQAPLWLTCAPERLGVDMLSLDAGKCYGPKGVGVLVHRPKAKLLAVTYGGSQESGVRPGTENTPLIVGCAAAITKAQSEYVSRSAATATLRDTMIELLLSTIDGAVLNGSHEHRIANNINISIPGIDTEFAVVTLDTHGIAASTKSACSGADGGGSQVIRHMTGDETRAQSTIRFSLGEATTAHEIKKTVEILSEHVTKMRAFHQTLT